MHLVLIDLVPALLSWEGRDLSEEPTVAPGAAHTLGHLFDRYQVIGVADAGLSAGLLRRHLEREGLANHFDTVLTTAAHGPRLSARTLRRIVDAVAPGERPGVVTGRPDVAHQLAHSRFTVVLTTQEEFEGVPDALAAIEEGRITP